MDNAQLSAWHACRQGLDGALTNQSPADILAKTGWARSVGGSGPYLGLFARSGIRRSTIDRDLEQCAIHELPSARGCTYLIPAAHYALALTVGQSFGHPAEMKVAAKLGVTEKEIAKLCQSVLKALASEPLEPDAIKVTVGSAVRNLGEAGKKKGITSTLPLALGRLQAEGEIRRIPTNGRLDQQRYRYARWQPNPLQSAQLTPEAAFTQLARLYFTWIGPARAAEFQTFAGLGVKATQAALEPLKLTMVPNTDLLLLPEHQKSFNTFKLPKDPHYTLVSSLDGLMLLRRQLTDHLDPADLKAAAAFSDERTGATLMDLPCHAILNRGRIIGLWEFDPEPQTIAWTTFIKPTPALRRVIVQTESYIREDLGDARSFSLDSPKSRTPRITALRKKQP